MSNAASGAVMKLWARQRFGAPIRHHLGVQDPDARAAEHAESVVREHGRSLDEMFRLLDYESAFHPYYLRRIHVWGNITLRRGMEQAEYRSRYTSRRFRHNAVASFSLGAPFPRRYRVQATIPIGRVPKAYWQSATLLAPSTTFVMPIGRVPKAYWQGERYLIPSETEHLIIGGEYRAIAL